ncbi:extracellular solute-binding protein family 1 [Paenibacillus curdlanolyticus YK9]|uniref:Extracellular solute-binding protein family 1 n=1 Tax=Paenibacillus curdlanolyticus YK9 TaxID=717606 RepID=E0IBL3_9BACL|nr:extracellular solute-binding protein [Paenibacillus curdlanolyticus]EFM10093.1 extracellular solute-binding protein family 1 [Paenibacillus curdlanolyticus YK9]
MKRKFSYFTAIPAVLMLATTLAACGGNGDSSSNDPAKTVTSEDGVKKPDTSKKVELVWYLVGEPHKDTQKVVDEWNKLLEKDLNTKIKLNFTTWAEWQTKYNLILSTGEKVDMIFASSWADYYKFAKRDAFLPLNDLLPVYAPETWSKVSKQDWEEATVKSDKETNGAIFAVPSTYPEYTPDGLVYREDWRQELKLPEIKDMDSLEAYFDGVKKGKPGVTPINGKAFNEVNALFKFSNGFETIGGGGEGNLIVSKYATPRDIVAYPFTAEFEAYVKRMKTWADKGFWTSDSLSSQKEPGDTIKTDNGAAYLRNAPAAGGYIMGLKTTNPDIKTGYFPFNRFNGYVMPTLSVNNAMAIPKSAPNPERSLMVLDKLRNDPKYFDLMTYGIEGTHYSIAEDGKTLVTPPAGMTVGKDWKKYDLASWGWRVDTMVREKQASGWPEFDKLLEEFKATSKPNIYAPIILTYDTVKSQQAAVNQVFEQYGKPLMMGFTDDVEKSLKTYRDQLTKAGIDSLVDYAKTEAYKYFDEKGIK